MHIATLAVLVDNNEISIATLAQLVEQRFCKAKVPSSSLGGGSREKCLMGVFRLSHFSRQTALPTSRLERFFRIERGEMEKYPVR
jgi:hypothetical protein